MFSIKKIKHKFMATIALILCITLSVPSNIAIASNTTSETATDSTSTSSSSTTSTTGSAVVNYARQFVGNPYVWGGTSLTNGCDCSGFVMQVYAHFGVSLPHSSYSLRSVGYAVADDVSQMQPGDIVCFDGHCGIYIGNNQMIHAKGQKYGIVVDSYPYTKQTLAVRRIFDEAGSLSDLNIDSDTDIKEYLQLVLQECYQTDIEKMIQYSQGNFSTTQTSYVSGLAASGQFVAFDASDEEIEAITALCEHMQGTSLDGVKAEASLMANRYQEYGGDYSSIYNYVKNCGWWSNARDYMSDTPSSEENVEAVKDVICNANRIFPSNVDERASSNEIISITTDGIEYTSKNDIKDTSNYKSGETIIKCTENSETVSYTFYAFAHPNEDTSGDSFGYTKEADNTTTIPGGSYTTTTSTTSGTEVIFPSSTDSSTTTTEETTSSSAGSPVQRDTSNAHYPQIIDENADSGRLIVGDSRVVQMYEYSDYRYYDQASFVAVWSGNYYGSYKTSSINYEDRVEKMKSFIESAIDQTGACSVYIETTINDYQGGSGYRDAVKDVINFACELNELTFEKDGKTVSPSVTVLTLIGENNGDVSNYNAYLKEQAKQNNLKVLDITDCLAGDNNGYASANDRVHYNDSTLENIWQKILGTDSASYSSASKYTTDTVSGNIEIIFENVIDDSYYDVYKDHDTFLQCTNSGEIIAMTFTYYDLDFGESSVSEDEFQEQLIKVANYARALYYASHLIIVQPEDSVDITRETGETEEVEQTAVFCDLCNQYIDVDGKGSLDEHIQEKHSGTSEETEDKTTDTTTNTTANATTDTDETTDSADKTDSTDDYDIVNLFETDDIVSDGSSNGYSAENLVQTTQYTMSNYASGLLSRLDWVKNEEHVDSRRRAIVETALSALNAGISYKEGGGHGGSGHSSYKDIDPANLDCSGFVAWVYYHSNITGIEVGQVKDYVENPSEYGLTQINEEDLKPGDLGCANDNEHCAIYIGTINGKQYWCECPSNTSNKLDAVRILSGSSDFTYFYTPTMFDDGSSFSYETTSETTGVLDTVEQVNYICTYRTYYFPDLFDIAKDLSSATMSYSSDLGSGQWLNAGDYTIPDNGSSMPIVYMEQGQPAEWADYHYGSGTLGSCGCGVACLAMTISYLRSGTDPSGWVNPQMIVDMIAEKNGGNYNAFYVQGAGSSWDIFSNVAGYYGLSANEISSSSIAQAIAKGHPVIMSCVPGEFPAGSGHFIVITGIRADGLYTVNDPNYSHRDKSFAYTEGKYSLDYLISQGKGWWEIYDPNGTAFPSTSSLGNNIKNMN